MKTNTLIAIISIFFSSVLYSQGTVSTLCRNPNLIIPDNSVVRDSVNFNNPSHDRILDVNVLIDTLLHTWVSDLSIYIRKNNIGIGARLAKNMGGSGENFIGTLFNDSAVNPPPGPPFTGTIRPFDSLSRFNNFNPNGFWLLEISDTASGDTGLLKRWCLIITSTNISGVIETTIIPNTYRLYQNYPNPFNPQTKIRYGIPKNSFVKLTVYNELGEEVAILENGYKTANTYEAVFDASNLPSGVYYYKLEADGYSDTKTMVIIK